MEPLHTQGVLFVHSCSRALMPHLEWAMGRALNESVQFDWSEQPALPDSFRTEYVWHGPVGVAPQVASSLLGWQELRFEITQDSVPGVDAGRWLYTPSLGIFHMQVDSVGNVVVPEDRIRYAIDVAADSDSDLEHELQLALGHAWDAELEPFRYAGDQHSSNIQWMRRSS